MWNFLQISLSVMLCINFFTLCFLYFNLHDMSSILYEDTSTMNLVIFQGKNNSKRQL